MDYALAKELKDAGFPQPDKSDFYNGAFSCGCNEGSDIEGEERKTVLNCGREYVYIPTLEELIEACGDNFVLERRYNHGSRQWTAGIIIDREGDIERAHEAESATEAVAMLWLALNRNV